MLSSFSTDEVTLSTILSNPAAADFDSKLTSVPTNCAQYVLTFYIFSTKQPAEDCLIIRFASFNTLGINSKAKRNIFRFVTPLFRHGRTQWNLPDQKQQNTCASMLQWCLPLTVCHKRAGTYVAQSSSVHSFILFTLQI